MFIVPEYIEIFLSLPIIFSLITIFQGCFGSLGVTQITKRIKVVLKSPIIRFLFVTAVAYTATSQIEYALITTFIFFILMHVARTKEEKKELGFLW